MRLQALKDRCNPNNWTVLSNTSVTVGEVTTDTIVAKNRVTGEDFSGTPASYNAIFSVVVPSSEDLYLDYDVDGSILGLKSGSTDVVVIP